MTVFYIPYWCVVCAEGFTVSVEPFLLDPDRETCTPLPEPLDLMIGPDWEPPCPICNNGMSRDETKRTVIADEPLSSDPIGDSDTEPTP